MQLVALASKVPSDVSSAALAATIWAGIALIIMLIAILTTRDAAEKSDTRLILFPKNGRCAVASEASIFRANFPIYGIASARRQWSEAAYSSKASVHGRIQWQPRSSRV